MSRTTVDKNPPTSDHEKDKSTDAKENTQFSEYLAQIDPAQTAQILTDLENYGEPLFTENDLNVSRPLTLLLRALCLRKHITLEKFKQAFTETADNSNMDSNMRNYGRNNLKRAVLLPNVTMDTFEKLMVIFHLQLTDMVLVVTDEKTGAVDEIQIGRAHV